MQTRISFDAVMRAAAAKAPIVAIPIEGCKVILPRARLAAILTCPKLTHAAIRNGDELKALVLTGKGAEYTLLSIDVKDRLNTGSEMLRKWAESQRKRRSTPKGKLGRKVAAIDKQIRILEKQMRYRWHDGRGAPKSPLLAVGKSHDWDFYHRGWLSNRSERMLRQKVGHLAMRGGWKRWADVITAVESVGGKFPAKPTLHGKRISLCEITGARELVAVCGLLPSWRHEDQYEAQAECEEHRRERDRWLASRRDRKALEQRLADLRELRTMPDKLAESDIGLPEDVTVEAIET